MIYNLNKFSLKTPYGFYNNGEQYICSRAISLILNSTPRNIQISISNQAEPGFNQINLKRDAYYSYAFINSTELSLTHEQRLYLDSLGITDMVWIKIEALT